MDDGMSVNPIIQIDNLSFSYPDGHPALHEIHIEIRPGEKVAAVGPNGAGKSTLLLHLNGILHGQGNVRVAGTKVNRKNVRTVRAQVGLIFQDPDDQLFSTTVFEDVAFGPLQMGLDPDEVRGRVTKALSAVGMVEHRDRMPHHLSLGERKRVAIATVLAMEPQVLVLDEPSAGLDPRTRRNLIDLLRALPQTMLIASHDMRLVYELCPRTVIMDGGRIVADGATAQLLQNASLMERHGLETPFQMARA
jgi:cobalt/nickel transport system ATP-binding protein